MAHCIYLGESGYNFNNNCIDSVDVNSVDPDEMPHHATFHLVFTVCKSTNLGGSSIYKKGFENNHNFRTKTFDKI